MLKVGTSTFRQFFCSTVVNKSHYFSQLELKDLLKQPNELRDSMIDQIRQRGELKIPEYWKQALTDQQYGYYRQSNVFSKEGDFTTSPEISSIFGQMVATWLAVFMQTPTVKVLDPLTNSVHKKFRLIELGGGRGLLMQDILKSFHSYQIANNFDLHFIEVSEFNRKEQQARVMEQFKKNKTYFRFDFQNATPLREDFLPENDEKNITLKWFSKLEDLLKEDYQAKKKGKEIPLTIFVMNEFFDALPVTILEYTVNGWREKVLSLSNNPQFPFELINSSHELHPKLRPEAESPEIGDRIQLSPQSLLTMDMMAKIIKYSGGAILNIDYGGTGPFVNSIRAIKSHKYIPEPYYWQVPGVCDLSAHVAFTSLAQYAQKIEGVRAFELIPQQFFLEAMGIQARLQNLTKNMNKEKSERLKGEVARLTAPEQMGEFYKVQIISLKEYGEIYPHITVSGNQF